MKSFLFVFFLFPFVLSAQIESPSEPQVEKELGVEELVFMVVEEMPAFPGGEEALSKFIYQNIELKTCGDLQKNKTVYVGFVVKKDGSIGEVKVLRGVDSCCNQACLAVIKKMPNWRAGKQNGKAVRVQYTVPIRISESLVGKPVEAEKETPNEKSIEVAKEFVDVDDEPEYPGGIVELYRDLSINLKYPTTSKGKKLFGIVYVYFVIDKKGETHSFKIIKGLSKELDAAAIEAIKNLKLFNPGLRAGEPVDVQMTIPIRFTKELLKASEKTNK